MSDETIIEDSFDNEWDLAEVLADRKQPTTSVDIYLSEEASYTRAQLSKALASEKNPDKLEAIQNAIDDVDKILEERKYTVHITAVPSRMREDIHSKALAAHPYKPNLMGMDDPEQARLRQKYENQLIWHAQITNVVNPLGKSKLNWTREQMDAFEASLPVSAQNAVDTAIKTITKEAEEYVVRSKSPDF